MFIPETTCTSLKTTELTRCKLRVVHLPVVGTAPLVQPRVRRRAAVAQRAGAAAHGGVHGVQVLRTLEALMIVPIRVQPAVAVLPLRVRYPQIPGQISEQQAVQQAHHPGERSPASCGGFSSGSVRVRGSSFGGNLLTGASGAEVVWELCDRHLSPSSSAPPRDTKLPNWKTNWLILN